MRAALLIGLMSLAGCEKNVTAQAPAPVKLALDTISEERAWELDGKLVTASLLIAKWSVSQITSGLAEAVASGLQLGEMRFHAF